MKKTLFATAIAMSLISASAFAATDAKPVSKWTCEDFLAIDDAFYPKRSATGLRYAIVP